MDDKNNKKIISYHNFMFPFRFDFIKKEIKDRHEYYKYNSFDDRVKINKEFYELLKKDDWEYKQFKIEENHHYNEFVYFHDFVKDSLFNISETFKKGATSWYFNKKFTNATFKFSVKIKKENGECNFCKNYEFKINSISLRIFDTGIGILSFDFENDKYSNEKDILKINEFGRRIYPQFLGKNGVEDTKNSFLADEISITIDNKEFKENFKNLNLNKIEIGNHIMSILGKNTFTQNLDDVNKYLIQHIIDDRMFVISWYGNNYYANKLQNYNYEDSDFWYEYLFIDGNGKTIQNEKMQKKLIKQATYDRWMNYGTLYGISRYSFVCLSDEDAFPLPHMKTMYFQIFTLILALRATILRFSDEITAISDIDENDNDKDLEVRVRNLYKNYLRFKNKIYFREVTAQDQGIELYEKALEILKMDKEINDLEREINALHTYTNMITEKKTNERMNELTKIGALFLPATLVAGIFGMNTFPSGWIDNPCGLIISIGVILCSIFFMSKKYDFSLKEFFEINNKKN